MSAAIELAVRVIGFGFLPDPCTRCGATPETGQREGCPECEGVVGALARGQGTK